MDLQLLDKHVLVTGGTRGIGLASVKQFLDEGCHVSTCARTAVDKASFELPADQANRLSVAAVDCADHRALETWAALKKWPTASFFCPVPGPHSSPAPISSSMAV